MSTMPKGYKGEWEHGGGRQDETTVLVGKKVSKGGGVGRATATHLFPLSSSKPNSLMRKTHRYVHQQMYSKGIRARIWRKEAGGKGGGGGGRARVGSRRENEGDCKRVLNV